MVEGISVMDIPGDVWMCNYSNWQDGTKGNSKFLLSLSKETHIGHKCHKYSRAVCTDKQVI